MRYLVLLFLILPALAAADVLEEVVVTGSRLSAANPPAKRLIRRGDNLLVSVRITNDSRDADVRESEIHETLLGAIRQANRLKGTEISVITDGGFVVQLNSANYQIDLSNGSRPDTSRANFSVKTAIPRTGNGAETQVANLKQFVRELKMVGRTEVEVEGDTQITIINPSSYRSAVIKLLGEDVKEVTEALGGDYRVMLGGVDRPVEWARVGAIDVGIYIPYEYLVIPTTLNSVTVPFDY
ncbi:MAG: hypothetical protein AAFQ62_04710 [Pseudomonadota bacterium]